MHYRTLSETQKRNLKKWFKINTFDYTLKKGVYSEYAKKENAEFAIIKMLENEKTAGKKLYGSIELLTCEYTDSGAYYATGKYIRF